MLERISLDPTMALKVSIIMPDGVMSVVPAHRKDEPAVDAGRPMLALRPPLVTAARTQLSGALLGEGCVGKDAEDLPSRSRELR